MEAPGDWMAAAIASAADQAPMPMTLIPDVVPGRVLQVDGDYLAYFMAGNDDTTIDTARANALRRILNFKEMAGAEKCFLHLTGMASNKAERYLIASVKPYQGKRSGNKPKNWEALRDWLESYDGPHFKPYIWGDREADDGMALLQYTYHTKGTPELIVSCTRDKDMRQYGGLHLGWMDYMLVTVDWQAYSHVDHDGLLYGHAWLWQQSLQGDSVDDIPGLPQYLKPNGKYGLMGEKTAIKFLEAATSDEEAFQVVSKLYGAKYLGLWGEMLAEQLMLLWLRRDPAATLMNFLEHLRLDRTTDNFRDLYEGAQAVCARVRAAKEQVLEIENRANRASETAALS
jgi:DNA polymerase-1